MSFVKFTLPDGYDVWINPDQVVSVGAPRKSDGVSVPPGDDWSIVRTSSTFYVVVNMNPEQAVWHLESAE